MNNINSLNTKSKKIKYVKLVKKEIVKALGNKEKIELIYKIETYANLYT